MIVDGFVDALEQLGQALAGATPGEPLGPADLPVHLLPMHGDTPVAAPCILVGWPRLSDPTPFAGSTCGVKFACEVDVTVVAENTRGPLLPILADIVMAQLADHGLHTTSTDATAYQPPSTPAGIPSVTLTVE